MKQIQRASFVVFSATMFFVSGFALAWFVVPQLSGNVANATDQLQPVSFIGSDVLAEQERVFSEIYTTVAPSVVAITVGERSNFNEELFVPASTGSGFVIDTQGHIVTNFHVVAGADRVEVSMFDGTVTEADIIGLDPDSDIAVVKVNLPADRLRPVTFADSTALQVGQMALALGNPFQRDWTLTSGIISGLERSVFGLNQGFSIGGVIQTDAAINPGNSGGPLLNLQGQVIGVNSQIETETSANSGVGFAVPSNLVNKIAQTLIANGEIQYSFIGIRNLPINLDLITAYELPNNLQGVAIRQVFPNTPASQAGLRSPSNRSVDIITAINGEPIDDFEEMIGYLALNTNPGDVVTFTVYRAGEILQLPVTLISREQYQEQE